MNKIKCPRPDCKGSGEFQYVGEDRKMTIVDEDGKVTFENVGYLYRCADCGIAFSSLTPPQIKRFLHG